MIQLLIGLGVATIGFCACCMAIKCFTKGLAVTRSKIVTGPKAWVSGILILFVGLFLIVTGLGVIMTDTRQPPLQGVAPAPPTPPLVNERVTAESSEVNQAVVIKPTPEYNFTDEWYAAKSECWQRVIQKYPDSGVNGSAFRNRMFEYDEWAKTNNPELYSDSNKPMIYADAVYKEMLDQTR